LEISLFPLKTLLFSQILPKPFKLAILKKPMITYIKGKLVEKTPTSVILDRDGFGYLLKISLNTYSAIQSLEHCMLYTSLVVKNENQSVVGYDLYGFATEQERDLFERMISVSGVGASTARMMLSSFKPDEVIQAIISENEGMIQSVKGIGPKSAKRIILELKDKVGKPLGDNAEISVKVHNNNREEALNALVTLGFGKPAIEKVLNRLLMANPSLGVETLIKEGLKVL
jgi:Holliday junction DNA helicase RuvA